MTNTYEACFDVNSEKWKKVERVKHVCFGKGNLYIMYTVIRRIIMTTIWIACRSLDCDTGPVLTDPWWVLAARDPGYPGYFLRALLTTGVTIHFTHDAIHLTILLNNIKLMNNSDKQIVLSEASNCPPRWTCVLTTAP